MMARATCCARAHAWARIETLCGAIDAINQSGCARAHAWARIETFDWKAVIASIAVAPALTRGRGLKQIRRWAHARDQPRCARAHAWARIETMMVPPGSTIANVAPALTRGRGLKPGTIPARRCCPWLRPRSRVGED